MRVGLGFLIVCAAGCLSAPPDQVWLQQRQGVAAIPDPERRSAALCAVCESAAHAGDAAAVKMLLGDLGEDPRHDELAGRCAVALASQDPANGRRIASLIGDDTLRQKTREQIAQREKEHEHDS